MIEAISYFLLLYFVTGAKSVLLFVRVKSVVRH